MAMCDRAHYLVIMYVFGSYKNVFITISTGYVVQVQVQDNCKGLTLQADNCKGMGRLIVQPTTSRDTLTRIEIQTANNSAETRRTKFSRNDRCLKNKISINKYYYNNASCLQSKLGATGIVCNMQYASGVVHMN